MVSHDDSEPIIVQIDAEFEPLIPTFMANRKREVVTLTELLARGDLDQVRKVAHGIKGAGGSYGFDELSTIAARLEQAAKAGDEVAAKDNLSLLASYLGRVSVVYE